MNKLDELLEKEVEKFLQKTSVLGFNKDSLIAAGVRAFMEILDSSVFNEVHEDVTLKKMRLIENQKDGDYSMKEVFSMVLRLGNVNDGGIDYSPEKVVENYMQAIYNYGSTMFPTTSRPRGIGERMIKKLRESINKKELRLYFLIKKDGENVITESVRVDGIVYNDVSNKMIDSPNKAWNGPYLKNQKANVWLEISDYQEESENIINDFVILSNKSFLTGSLKGQNNFFYTFRV